MPELTEATPHDPSLRSSTVVICTSCGAPLLAEPDVDEIGFGEAQSLIELHVRGIGFSVRPPTTAELAEMQRDPGMAEALLQLHAVRKR
jgi:hypothetical protein